MGILRIIRITVHVLAILTTLVAFGLTAAAVLTSGWQIMNEPGTGEIHQHGLWLDYNRVRPHVAGLATSVDDPNRFQWIFNYKFGSAVVGDEVHKAQAYQENALILLSVAMALSLIGALVSYCAGFNVFLALGWTVCMFLAAIFGAAGLIQFYVSAMSPEHRYVYTDRRMEQVVGYSFWYGVVGTVGFALAMIGSIVCAILIFLDKRHNGEKTQKVGFTFKKGSNTQV